MNNPSATELDKDDSFLPFRDDFNFPKTSGGGIATYLCGNSLGLQPKRAHARVNEVLSDWAQFAVEGHFRGDSPWFPYHEFVTVELAKVVGAKPIEVVAMNTLTVNLHLMLISFYRPTGARHRILIEEGAFPSDRYAVVSQIKLHGYSPENSLQVLSPRDGETVLRQDDILSTLERDGESIALVLLGNVNYLTGQAFDICSITNAAKEKGCAVGWDLAHGAGNLLLRLHDWNVDFAVWCHYKYLNAGPGSIGGCFVHERHARRPELPRLCGWWGHNKGTRFEMPFSMDLLEGAEGWQLSNPSIFSLASLRASLDLFDRAGMDRLRNKSERLTGFLEENLLKLQNDRFSISTPRQKSERGAQLSLKFKKNARAIHETLLRLGVFCDFRAPDTIRVSPVPLYNNFCDIERFLHGLQGALLGEEVLK